ncbi:MAG: hypothetical protein NZ551_09400 [Microscillaceae bacterium]|nr:hypothetical protein [Microscillaceae bacterium]MDW8461416.1 hypothetical protein [Cytophagales bacterium]
MQKIVLIIVLFILVFYQCSVQAQYVEKEKRQKTSTQQDSIPKQANRTAWESNLRIGGNFFVSFTHAFVNLSPTVSYVSHERLTTAVGITYIYRKFTNFDAQVYGVRAIGNYLISRNLLLTVEGEYLNTLFYDSAIQNTRRTWIWNPLLGLTYRFLGAYALSVLFNFNHQEGITPYPSPLIIRVGTAF